MVSQEIEPLDAELWFAEMEKLVAQRQSVDGEAPDRLFRKALYLIQLAPMPLRHMIPAPADEDTIEAFLDCGAYSAAAAALFAPPAGVTLVRDAGSETMRATVTLLGQEGSGEDADTELGKALLGAWCKAVLSLKMSMEPLSAPRVERGPKQPNHQALPTRH